jgi:hypothetical protein
MKPFKETFDIFINYLKEDTNSLDDPKLVELLKSVFYVGAYKYMVSVRNEVNEAMTNKTDPATVAQEVSRLEKEILEYLNNKG